ncbi:MAG: hypothetical protein ACYC64_03950 [Armatimonadota bacterium]
MIYVNWIKSLRVETTCIRTLITDLKREGKPVDFSYPNFEAGHAETLVLEAAINSNKTGVWVKVGQ